MWQGGIKEEESCISKCLSRLEIVGRVGRGEEKVFWWWEGGWCGIGGKVGGEESCRCEEEVCWWKEGRPRPWWLVGNK